MNSTVTTKALSQLAMNKGVRVNAVAPGPMWTPLFVFLASNESRFVSGEVYGATGGRTPY